MILLVAAAAFLATPLNGLNVGPQLGQATRSNFEAMIVPPAPRGPAVEGADGIAAVGSVARMHADKTRPLKNTSISPSIVWDRSAK